MSTVLAKADIQRLLQQQPPLFEGYINLDEQMQPNGFDLTLRDIAVFQSAGSLGASNAQRRLPDLQPLSFDKHGFRRLPAGIYLVTFNEVVNLPKNVMALARPRSSLLRSGVTVDSAVWDAGYCGRSQSLLIVYNPEGFRVQQNARLLQLVFFQLTQATDGYNGQYQGENISRA